MPFRKIALITVCAAGLALVGCDSKDSPKKKAAGRQLPISVVSIKEQLVNIPYKSVGSIRSLKNPLVRSEVKGRVLKLFVHTGYLIKPNQSLVQLNNIEGKIRLKQAKDHEIVVEKKFINDRLTAERLKEGYQKGAISFLKYKKSATEALVSKKELAIAKDGVQQAQNNLKKSLIKSPISGHIQKIFVSVGDYVSPGDKILQIINHDMLQAELPFSQDQVSHFEVGQSVKFTSPASPHNTFNGVISAIEPSIDPNNRTFHVYIRFSGNGDWRSGSSAHAAITLDKPIVSYVIPKESIVLKKTGKVIYYVKDDKAYVLPVTTLYYWKDKVAISTKHTGPLKVVVDGAHYLANGTPIKIVK